MKQKASQFLLFSLIAFSFLTIFESCALEMAVEGLTIGETAAMTTEEAAIARAATIDLGSGRIAATDVYSYNTFLEDFKLLRQPGRAAQLFIKGRTAPVATVDAQLGTIRLINHPFEFKIDDNIFAVTDNVFLRTEDAIESNIITTVHQGDLAIRLTEQNGWYQVKIVREGKVVYGFIDAKYLLPILLLNNKIPSGFHLCNSCHGMGHLFIKSFCKVCHATGQSECVICHGTGHFVCENCHGKGKFVCPNCNGERHFICSSCNGERQFICSNCDGKGHNPCGKCDGTGKIATNDGNERCDACNGTGILLCSACQSKGYVPCFTCGQTGYIPCQICNNIGYIPCNACGNSGIKYCATCHRTGKIFCKTCSGSGIVESYRSCEKCDGKGIVRNS